ncbi:MAG: Fe-S cluster assembly protein HesB [Chloroflexota bacterium]
MQLSIPARPPFDFNNVVRSHGWYQLAPFHYDEAAGVLTYVDRLASGRVLALGLSGGPAQACVTLESELASAEIDEVRRKVSWMLGLEQDFSAFYALASQEPKLEHVAAAARGRVLRSPTFFEDVVKTILTTNTQWGGTIRMDARLVGQYGEPLPLAGEPLPLAGERRAFPTPQRLAEVDEASLRQAVGLGYRAPYVLELARRAAGGELDLEAFKTSDLPTLELRKRLLAIKGIGAYAAANLLMLLGRYDFLPIDSWALKVVSHEWHHGEAVTPAQVEAAFEGWGAWKGLAYWFWQWSLFSEG